MGDVNEYGSFAKFQAHVRQARLDAARGGVVTYRTGDDTLVATWSSFTVNDTDPFAYAKEQSLWQDTSLTQMGRSRLEKQGAVIERPKSWANMFLQTFPKQKVYVALNLLPNYLVYRFREPGGVRIMADGACSMGCWAVKASRRIDIRYHAFGGEYLPQEKDAAPATLLWITGAKGKLQVTLNGRDVTAALSPGSRTARTAGWCRSAIPSRKTRRSRPACRRRKPRSMPGEWLPMDQRMRMFFQFHHAPP